MGADGGVVYIPLHKPNAINYNRVLELLNPFWQFLCTNGAHWAEDANWEWQQNNSIKGPEYILGYYGTDRVDNFDLTHLYEICNNDLDELYDLTFDELDLERRTNPVPVDAYCDHILHNLWYEHFKYSSREEVLSSLGTLSNLKIKDWVKELNDLLDFKSLVSEQTWT